MDKQESISHEEQRKMLWATVWAATASASNCRESITATTWADKALKEFDIRFPKSIRVTQNEP
jgi:hypothetical protein